jgi:hypothetical protein
VPEPDFVGLGALHCGTTWWFDLLTSHPRVERQLTRDRDGGFFAPFAERPLGEEDVAAFYERFRRRPGAICGEWGGRYLSDVWIAPLLARVAPRARLLVVLRDPIERYLTVLARSGEDPPHMAAVAHQARYGSQLRSLLRFVPREQLLIQQVERCRADVRGELRRTLGFLGLDDGEVPPDSPHLTVPPADPRAEPWPDLLASLREMLEPEVCLAAKLGGDDLDLRWWPHFRDLPWPR